VGEVQLDKVEARVHCAPSSGSKIRGDRAQLLGGRLARLLVA
jgi:hypothetical protein